MVSKRLMQQKKYGNNVDQPKCDDCKASGKPCDGTCGDHVPANKECSKPIENISDCYKNTADLTCTSIRATSTFIAVSIEKALLQDSVFTEVEVTDSMVFSITWAFLINAMEPTCIDNIPAFAKIAVFLSTSQLFADLATDRQPGFPKFLMEIVKKYISISIMDAMLV